MTIEAIMGKLSDVLSKEELEELQKISEVSGKDDNVEALTRKQKEADAKAARILDEKKKVKAENQALLEKIEQLESSGLSEIEKVQKELEKANKAREKYEKELGEVQANYKSTIRNQHLNEVKGKIKFLDNIPEDMRKLSIENAFKGIEDLSDEATVNETLKAYREANKGILQADTQLKSSGMMSSISANAQPSNKKPEDQTIEERAAQIHGKNKANVLSRL
jgi:hypothetical protein